MVIGIACRSLILIKNVHFIYFLPNSKKKYGWSDTTNLNCCCGNGNQGRAVCQIWGDPPPHLTRFTNSKLIGQEWRVERWKIPRLPGSLFGTTLQWRHNECDASQITGVLIVYSTICSGADQRKHQSSASLVCEGNSSVTGEYTVIIEIVWTFYLKSVPAKFKKYSKLISWVISGTSLSKLSCNPRQPSEHQLQPSSPFVATIVTVNIFYIE